MIYLDNAATTFPKPQRVISAMCEAQRFYGANPGRGGHKMTLQAGRKVFFCRSTLADFFGAQEERVIFTLNCTSALNTAVKGSVKKGDHVIISSLEHNSVLRPIHKLCEQGKITYDVFEVNPSDEKETINNFRSLINDSTSLVVCTMVSNVFGTVLPFIKIGEICRKRNIRFILDGAQGAGSHRINLREMSVDILCLPGHKGLLGPMGTGVLVLGENIEIDSLVEGGTGSSSLSASQPDFYPDRLESGTANLPGIVGLHEGVKFIRCFGGEGAVLKKESCLMHQLVEDLSVIPNLTVYDKMHTAKTNVLSFNVAGKHSEEVAESLDKMNIAVRAGYHCAYLAHKNCGTTESGTVRVSTGVFNTKKDIKNLAFYLNKIAKERIL